MVKKNPGAYARRADPDTSHAAAAGVKTNELEQAVIDALDVNGPMSSEETSNFTGLPLQSITPRFKPLTEKGITKYLRDYNDDPVTRPGKSGSPRHVFELVRDRSKWHPRQNKRTKKELLARVEKLETGLKKIRWFDATTEDPRYVTFIDRVLSDG